MPGRKWVPSGRSALVAVVIAVLVGVSGCASLPDSSTPQAIGTVNTDPPGSSVAVPTPGREPDLLLRDFFKASTDPSGEHLAARQFLTPTASGRWDDGASVTIVDKIDVLPESRSANKATYTIRANKVGQLEPGGLYVAVDGSFEEEISFSRHDGEWRISDLPEGVILDRAQFLNSYQRKSLYFIDPGGTMVVPDPRWVWGPQDQMASQLVGLLMEGPKGALAPAVRNELGGEVSVLGPITKADGRTAHVGLNLGGIRIDFGGLGVIDEQTKQLFAAQVIWTLANAGISGPYVLLADGQPLDGRYPNGWTTADVSSMNPFATSSAAVGLHALREGSMVSVTEAGVIPVPGYFGSAGNIQSLALSQNGQMVAAVADTDLEAPEPTSALMVGRYGEDAAVVLEGDAITRPTWAPGSSAIWAVVNGDKVIRVLRDPNTGLTSVADVDAGAVTALGTTITEMRLSRDGVRAALIVDGKVYLAIVTQMPDGEYALTNPHAVANGLGSPAIALDWSTSDTIVVARSASEIPVVQVAVDGSRLDALPSRNLTTPVLAVDASTTTEFVADSRAVFQLNNNDPAGDRYWREVPGLTGVKAIPIQPG
ncbi:MtrAB system accessory lipoprotein LpqB [Rhodococcus sp. NPDC049939]|uniref:MtrAB system accessory lipoprotein LpqB n=1 Tax=Rhodococcus sp. NPDC049939 TaxID=3155511 RepID=UPI0033CADEEC